MATFAIIEVDDGLAVATIQPGQTPEEAAVVEHGVLVDPGPYVTYDEAYDALCQLGDDDDDDDGPA